MLYLINGPFQKALVWIPKLPLFSFSLFYTHYRGIGHAIVGIQYLPLQVTKHMYDCYCLSKPSSVLWGLGSSSLCSLICCCYVVHWTSLYSVTYQLFISQFCSGSLRHMETLSVLM